MHSPPFQWVLPSAIDFLVTLLDFNRLSSIVTWLLLFPSQVDDWGSRIAQILVKSNTNKAQKGDDMKLPLSMRNAQHRPDSTPLNNSPGQIDNQDSRITYNLSFGQCNKGSQWAPPLICGINHYRTFLPVPSSSFPLNISLSRIDDQGLRITPNTCLGR